VKYCADSCQVEDTLQFVAGKWKSVILYRLFQEQVGRFSDFKRWLPRISTMEKWGQYYHQQRVAVTSADASAK